MIIIRKNVLTTHLHFVVFDASFLHQSLLELDQLDRAVDIPVGEVEGHQTPGLVGGDAPEYLAHDPHLVALNSALLFSPPVFARREFKEIFT